MRGAHGYIQLIATGGTISIGPDGPLRAKSIIKMARRLPKDIPIRADDSFSIPSSQITIDQIHALADHVRTSMDDPDCLGVIITHGTDTMQESALAVELLCAPTKPVVFTGAMIPTKDRGADGPANVADAIDVVLSESTSTLGTIVVMNAKVHAALDVRKRHTTAIDSFNSGEAGPIGIVSPGTVEIVREAPRLGIQSATLDPRVEIIRCAAASDGRSIERAIEDGIRGLIVEALGIGNLPGPVLSALQTAGEAGVVVLLTSRVPDGPIEFQRKVLEAGCIPAIAAGRRLTSEAARITLMAMLGQGLSIGEIARKLASG